MLQKSIAKFAFANAPALCDANHHCRDYHRIWGIARLAREDGSPPAGSEFFKTALGEYKAINAAPRILVCGGADHGVLAMLQQICHELALRPRFLFVDRCATPVQANRLYAKQTGFDLVATEADILAVDVGEVDIVVAHSLLNFLGPGDRLALFQHWSRILHDDGVILVSNRLTPLPEMLPTAAEEDNFSARLAALQLAGLKLGLGPFELEELDAAARRVWSGPISGKATFSRQELDKLVAGSGLTLAKLTEQARNRPGQKGPLAGNNPETAVRAEIVLRK